MSNAQDKPATPQNSQDRSPARQKDQAGTDKPKDDLPGADGKTSAGASEDTYD